MNYMGKVAEMLGIEMNDKFKIRFCDNSISGCYYVINEKGICEFGIDVSDPQLLQGLICGNCTIVKEPWKPKRGERYYYAKDDFGVKWELWNGTSKDYALFHLGNCFKSAEDVTAGKKLEWHKWCIGVEQKSIFGAVASVKNRG